MYHVRNDTLAFHRARPLFLRKNIADLPMSGVAAKLSSYMDAGQEHASVEMEALRFYLLNHAFATVTAKFDPFEPLPEQVNKLADLYVESANEIALRLLYYVLMIITREARHMGGAPRFHSKLIEKIGVPAAYFIIEKIVDKSSSDAVGMVRQYPPAASLGAYITGICYVFEAGSFHGGFGGRPWWNIAETLRKFVYGEISAELFVDVAWTLCHNNGPMFNKGMLYKMYTKDIYKILDVQRSGQIPQLIGNKEFMVQSVVEEAWKLFHACFPQETSGHVDWYAVEMLGALHHYPNEKTKQEQKYGLSLAATALVMKKNAEMAKKIAEEQAKFYIKPGEWAMKVERKVA